MLKAFKKQLIAQALDPKDSFSEEIRQSVGPRESVRYQKELREMIIAMPDLVAQLTAWSRKSESPARLRRLHRFAVAYLLNPTDFMPERKLGFIGYLDDAYLITRVFDLALQESEWVPSIGDYEKNTGVWITMTRELFPEMTLHMDRIIHQLTQPTSGRSLSQL